MLASRSARSWLVATAAASAVLLSAGCSPGSKGIAAPSATETVTVTVTASPAPAADGAAGRPGTGNDTATSGASVAAAPLPVLAQATSADNQNTYRVTVNRLSVSGQLLQLTFSVTDTKADGFWIPGGAFNNGIRDADGPLASTDSETADGATLIDTKNAKRYLVARGPSGLCACSSTSGVVIGAGKTVSFTATFKAPPADVTAMTVMIPKVPTFANVPVQR